jgi:hypothetical protein
VGRELAHNVAQGGDVHELGRTLDAHSKQALIGDSRKGFERDRTALIAAATTSSAFGGTGAMIDEHPKPPLR